MEVIRKKISVSEGLNYENSMIPYIEYGGTSNIISASTLTDTHGNFCCDFELKNGKKYVYKSMLKKYHTLQDILRNGTLVELRKNSCDSTVIEKTYAISEEKKNSDNLFGSAFTPYNSSGFTYNENNTFTYTGTSTIASKINIIDDYTTYDTLGGSGYLHTVKQILDGNTKIQSAYTPYWYIPIFLSNTINDLGLSTDYLDSGITFEDESITYEKKGGISYDISGTSMSSNTLSSVTSLVTAEVESQLQSLRSPVYYTSDDGDLPGIFVDECKFYRANKKDGKWSLTETDGSSLECGDDEDVNQMSDKKYQTFSLSATVVEYLKNLETSKDNLYFYIRYKNDVNNPMTIPYVSGVPYNNYFVPVSSADTSNSGNTYIGDYISAITINDKYINFVYVIAGKYEQKIGQSISAVSNTGIKYEEQYPYVKSKKMTVSLDGYENIPIYYQSIDFDNNKKIVYSENLNLTREAVIGKITTQNIGDIWNLGITFDGDGVSYSESGKTINVPVFKQETLLGQQLNYKSDIDIEINRGNATAFEKHFKIGECNTMEDLENMGNNFFNI